VVFIRSEKALKFLRTRLLVRIKIVRVPDKDAERKRPLRRLCSEPCLAAPVLLLPLFPIHPCISRDCEIVVSPLDT